ncbi:hypothetical protein XH86_28380 [Bradyrhizobium guangdongense]|uniref:DUF982 domain-containing protein n=1 Tax=Bradyrhizobium guangdongense TaxID=1325090 RepID=A0ABX6ULH1_9BRAD|nr:hypothetical protein X265_28345 [Bradyrhizobium guangdongense]QOZ62216.1 hypothetical protein XH86_28380 [Bradyrhizobium guangdongense]
MRARLKAGRHTRCERGGAGLRLFSFWGDVRSARRCEERLRRSNPDCLRGKALDCFAALAMTTEEAYDVP